MMVRPSMLLRDNRPRGFRAILNLTCSYHHINLDDTRSTQCVHSAKGDTKVHAGEGLMGAKPVVRRGIV